MDGFGSPLSATVVERYHTVDENHPSQQYYIRLEDQFRAEAPTRDPGKLVVGSLSQRLAMYVLL